MITAAIRLVAVAVALFLLMVFSSFTAFAANDRSLPFSTVKEGLHTESIEKIESDLIDSLPDANEGNESWTLRAEAYGFYPAEAQVHLEENQTVKTNFVLDPIPKGTITGRVVDRYSGDPAAYATLRLKEDPRIPVVTADENGEFVIPDVYEGDYTLRVLADGFEPGEVSVTVVGNETTEIEIPLKRFVGYEEGNPLESVKPGKPLKPGKPGDPGKPGKPEQPKQPKKPGQPEESGKPGKPEKPEEPEKPGKSERPGKPGK